MGLRQPSGPTPPPALKTYEIVSENANYLVSGDEITEYNGVLGISRAGKPVAMFNRWTSVVTKP